LIFGSDCGATPPPANPFETGLADLWIRTASPMTIDQRRQFRQGVENTTTSQGLGKVR
jgi:germacradienol/geosmin synthase